MIFIEEDKRKVVAYCRFSSKKQENGASIEAQQFAIETYCRNRGMTISDFYIDRAISGTIASKRPSFLEMIEDCKKGDISEIVVHKLDRFARNAYETQTYIRMLEDMNVKVTSVAETFDDSPSGKLILGIMSDLAEFYSRNLASEVMKGLLTRGRQACFLGGTPPLGYKIVTDEDKRRRYEIDSKEAPAIRKIFEMFADGYSYQDISDWLNSHGYVSKAGNKFGKNSLHDIITNPRYKGEYVFNRTAHPKNDGRKNSHQHKSEEEIIRIPGGVPAIVSEELFAKANEKMEFRKRVRCDLDSKYKFLLTGIVFCECGSSMTSNVHHNGSGKAYPNYRCSKKGNSYSCKAKEINSKMLESFVVSELRKFLYNDVAIKEISKEINEAMKKRIKEKKDSIGALKKELDKLRRAQKNVLDAIVSTGISPALREKLDEVELEIKLREQQINDAEHTAESFIPVNPAAVKACIKDMKNVLKKADFESIKRLIFDFVEKVTVYSDHVEVVFKLPVPLNPELVKPALCKTVSKTTDNIIINHSA